MSLDWTIEENNDKLRTLNVAYTITKNTAECERCVIEQLLNIVRRLEAELKARDEDDALSTLTEPY